jgi:hypothetical protein
LENFHAARLALEQAVQPSGTPRPVLRLAGARVEQVGPSVPKRGQAPRRDPLLQKSSNRGSEPVPGPASSRQYAYDDITNQIARLMAPDFLVATPWEWLRHYPRYFRAVRTRLESLAANPIRDRQSHDEFQPRWQACLARAAEHEAAGVFDPELVQYRWMLEEYRVSLFAQKLGTSEPVSSKRLDRQWEKVRL